MQCRIYSHEILVRSCSPDPTWDVTERDKRYADLETYCRFPDLLCLRECKILPTCSGVTREPFKINWSSRSQAAIVNCIRAIWSIVFLPCVFIGSLEACSDRVFFFVIEKLYLQNMYTTKQNWTIALRSRHWYTSIGNKKLTIRSVTYLGLLIYSLQTNPNTRLSAVIDR